MADQRDKAKIKGAARHRFLNEVTRFTVGRPFCRKFNFTPLRAPDVSGPMLLVANHNMDHDPFILSLSFRRQIYYVASEHIFRWGLLSKLLKWVYDPISKQKGNADLATVREILARLKAGGAVALFAEGNRSWDGVTGVIMPAAGKLAKIGGATLVTYRLEGGYLTRPRWSEKARRGKMTGSVVNVYPPEELRKMSLSEINEAIVRDIHEDAFLRQRQAPVAFKGENLAEGLETALYACPACRSIGTLLSGGDTLRCRCGFECRYNEYGFFEGAPFETVRGWNIWQRRLLAEKGERAEVGDPAGRLNKIIGHKTEPAAEGKVVFNAQGLKVGSLLLPLSSISSMSIYGRSTAVFSAGRDYYELRFPGRANALKYEHIFNILKGGIK